MTEALLTVEEAAERLKMHPDTLRRHLRRGEIRAVKRGPRLWRIPESALDAPNLESSATGDQTALYPMPFPNGVEVEEPDLTALFAPRAPAEIARRLAALDSLGQQTGRDQKEKSALDDSDPTAGIRQSYDERAAQLMDGHR